jgi:L-rhamnose isomerase
LERLERQKRRYYVSSIAVQEHFWNDPRNALWNAYCEPTYWSVFSVEM